MKKITLLLLAVTFSHFCFCQNKLDPIVLYKLNLGLSEPQNDFAGAQLLSVLRSLSPGASLTDLMVKMENGISENNYLHKTLKSLIMMYGRNKQTLRVTIVSAFHFTYPEADYFLEGGNGWAGFLNNTDIFENLGYNTKIKKWVAAGALNN